MTVSPSEIEVALDALKSQPYDPRVFPLRFLEAHDLPKSTISRLKASIDTSILNEDVILPKKFCFRHTEADSGEELARMMGQKVTKSSPRFLFTTDGRSFSGFDRNTGETWHDTFDRLNDHFNMTLPLAGIERYKSVDENPADIKAAGRLAKFYDAILETNKEWTTDDFRHALNLFMTRVLFCMFAEDTGIIADEVFTATLEENTKVDGSDVDQVLARVFEAMNLKIADRGDFPAFVRAYPYVNGGLFRDQTPVPIFSRKSRRILIDACQLDWAEINPDIFGSMIQGVVDPDKRGELGMHYTSVPNIMKVIGPLFLDSMQAEFQAAGKNPRRLQALLNRIYNLRIFDPACGSGNFLIIAYRELRRLELAVIERLQSLPGQGVLPMSQIRLSQFFGIEYTDFATETAKLSLWIAEHQANKEFKSILGTAPPDLPLRDSGNIVRGNALRTDWNSVCRVTGNEEVYVVGNPPYLGRAKQSRSQKEDMAVTFGPDFKGYAKLDYVAAWVMKACQFLKGKTGDCALVVTNSICQGDQVSTLWPEVIKAGFHINFAYTSFKWSNSASKKAAVTCAIVGFSQQGRTERKIFDGDTFRVVPNISPYLINYENAFVRARSTPYDSRPVMNFGSMANDGGSLFLTAMEYQKIIAEYPEASAFMRRAYGSREYVKSIERWCIWFDETQLVAAREIPELARRIDAVATYRKESDRAATRELANVPYRFGEVRYSECDHVLVVPRHFSENRTYLTVGVVDGQNIVSDACMAIHDCPLYIMALMSSRMHILWAELVAGRIKTDLRYSNLLVYNTFPVPELSERQIASLEQCAWDIIAAREESQGLSLATMYTPGKMPENLLAAHRDLDVTVERIYKQGAFRDDVDRLRHMLRLYEALGLANDAEDIDENYDEDAEDAEADSDAVVDVLA
jgi:hypothetical protein